jgi:uncharacterized protein
LFKLSFLLVLFGVGLPRIFADSVAARIASLDVSTTRPSSLPARVDADAARRAILKDADAHIASLRALLDQLPTYLQGQSAIHQRLQEALVERAKFEIAPDAEIFARFASVRAASVSKAEPQSANLPARRRGVATTLPVVGELETRAVFPGSASQGQMRAQVRAARGCEILTLHAKDGTTIAGLFGKRAEGQTGARPAILYFYGNGMCMADSLFVFNRFRGLGFDVVMVDYEGYGMSDGRPSEAGCYAAADAAYDYLLSRSDVDHGRIVATGWSLGAAVAIDLASRRHVAGLATFSAFTNIDEMSATIAKGLPLGILLESDFDNLAKMRAVSCPIFMAHGTNDPLVPPEMMERLSKAAEGGKVTAVWVSGAGHNDVFERGGDWLYNRFKVFVEQLPVELPSTMPAAG